MIEQLAAVQRMQNYIEEHLFEEISPGDLAQAALFSPWYSQRLFKRHLDISPAEYIRKLRLARSAAKLKEGGERVVDVAFETGFGSADGYTRAFYREYGCNPSDYAKNPVPIKLFIPYGVKFRELRESEADMDKVQSVFIQVITKPQRAVLVKRGVHAEDYFAYCNEVGCDVWGLLMSMDSACGEPVCLWLPSRYKKPDTSTYVQGVEVEHGYSGNVPEGFDVIELPEAEYLMFQGEPFAEEDYADAIVAIQHAMDRYDPTFIGYVWDDENPRIQLEPRGERGYIELRAVKKDRKE